MHYITISIFSLLFFEKGNSYGKQKEIAQAKKYLSKLLFGDLKITMTYWHYAAISLGA